MHAVSSSVWFSARTVVALVGLAALVALAANGQQQDGCRVECYPNTKMINGKGGVSKGDNCRWILRTDGKPARLCDHIKCRKVCPNNQAASAAVEQQEAASSSDSLKFEQKLEGDSQIASVSASQAPADNQPMGIMRQLHGNKLAKAPVPGVAGGRLAAGSQASGSSGASAGQARRTAPTLPPAVQYDENDTPPPISRFLDISPEE